MIRYALLLIVLAGAALAEPRQTLGWGRLLTNDVLGDLYDRWHSGSYTISMMRGPEWTGQVPDQFGALLEYRLVGSTLTPANLANPGNNDRPYVAPLSLGVHSYSDWRGMQARFGLDLVFTGPQTGVARFQSWLHDVLGVTRPDLDSQLGNHLYPTISAEVSRRIEVADHVSLTPFFATQAGVESWARVGGDLQIGSFGQGGLMLREGDTGQMYRGIAGNGPSAGTDRALSFSLGADIAHVFGSAYLPDDGDVTARPTRRRLRAGIAWQGERTSAFYGLTYLSPDFKEQKEGQILGSVNLNFRF